MFFSYLKEICYYFCVKTIKTLSLWCSVCVVAFVLFIAVDKVTDGAVGFVLLCIELFVVANIVGVGNNVGVKLQLYAGCVLEVSIAIDIVTDVSCVLDGVKVRMYEVALVGKDNDGELVARHDTATCGLHFLDEEGIVGSVLYLVGDTKCLPLDDRVVMAYRIYDYIGGRLQLLLARNEKEEKEKESIVMSP